MAHSPNKLDGTAGLFGTSAICFRCRRGQGRHVRRRSMTNRFLISVAAAALIAGTGFVNAQGTGGGMEKGGGAGGATTQQQPSGGGGGMEKGGGGTSGMKGAE